MTLALFGRLLSSWSTTTVTEAQATLVNRSSDRPFAPPAARVRHMIGSLCLSQHCPPCVACRSQREPSSRICQLIVAMPSDRDRPPAQEESELALVWSLPKQQYPPQTAVKRAESFPLLLIGCARPRWGAGTGIPPDAANMPSASVAFSMMFGERSPDEVRAVINHQARVLAVLMYTCRPSTHR